MQQTIKKIAIIGPESTGKSTVTKGLAEYFDTTFVPEFAREYIGLLKRPYVYADLWRIAKGQLNLEDQQMNTAKNGLIFCDTDLYVVKVWSEHKYGRCDDRILQEIARRKYNFYFLTDIDLPWESDPQREHPQPEMRRYFFNVYRDIAMQSGVPWTLLSGDKTTRLNYAVTVLKRHFGSF